VSGPSEEPTVFEASQMEGHSSANIGNKQGQVEILSQGRPGSTVPAVTVAISLYNYRDYIIRCLDSVSSQTVACLDLIVVDDCSGDGSERVVCEWLAKSGGQFSNYHLIRHKVNMGLPFSRNTAFTHARTEYVFVLDADNLLYPRCLERLVSALENCNASFAYCYLEKFGEDCGLQNTRRWSPITLKCDNSIDAMVLHRKSVWAKVGGYATDMPVMGWEDFDFWFRIAKTKGWGVQIPEILARYRISRTSMLHTVTNPNADKLWAYLRSKHPEFFGV
jgi:glycosyltransferase involved in cell wall biosynthesis